MKDLSYGYVSSSYLLLFSQSYCHKRSLLALLPCQTYTSQFSISARMMVFLFANLHFLSIVKFPFMSPALIHPVPPHMEIALEFATTQTAPSVRQSYLDSKCNS